MKTISILLTCILIAFAPAYAEQQQQQKEDEHLKAAIEFLEVSGFAAATESDTEQTVDAEIKESPELAPHREVMIKFYKENFSWEHTKNIYASAFMKKITTEEFKKLTAYYKGKQAKENLDKLLPEILQESQEQLAKRLQDKKGELTKQLK